VNDLRSPEYCGQADQDAVAGKDVDLDEKSLKAALSALNAPVIG
jgi:hypothetical protein